MLKNDLMPIPEAPPTITVLVVEDEILIRLDVSDELRRAGHCVLEASSAEDALDLLAADGSVDVVFSDYQLAGAIDGCELWFIVAHRYPALPFVLTSAQNAPSAAQENGIPFIPKPYRPQTVISAINNAVIVQSDTDEPD